MLAEKAAGDADLKDLMRIVANGEASSAELKRFQLHIDELSRLLKSRQNSTQPSTPSSQPQAPPPPSSTTTTAIAQTNGHPTPPPPKPISLPPTPVPQAQSQPQQTLLRSKGPPPSTKSEYSGIALEFTSPPGSGDRYLFPRFSILEILPGGQVLASFLIVRKGSDSAAPSSYDPQLDYYQPVTIRMYTHQGRQLEILQKTTAEQEEVRRYMEGVMDGCTRAEYVLLAMRLPREGTNQREIGEGDGEKEDEAVLWGRSSGLVGDGLSARQGKRDGGKERVVDEEERYREFVRGVAAS